MASLTVYKQPVRFTFKVLRFGGSKSPLESTSSSSSEIVGAIPALAKTWSILPYLFTASLKLHHVSDMLDQFVHDNAHRLICCLQSVTSTLENGTEPASGSGNGLRSPA